MAKTIILIDVIHDKWVDVGNYVGSPECANILQATPLECGQEMYSNFSWILYATLGWCLPRLVDLMAGLALTHV